MNIDDLGQLNRTGLDFTDNLKSYLTARRDMYIQFYGFDFKIGDLIIGHGSGFCIN